MNIKLLFIITCILLSFTSSAQNREFAGLNFGVGVSLTHDTGNNGRIQEAFIDETGKVRIKKDQNDIARIMLESHYFFTTEKADPKAYSFFGMTPSHKWGHGPFIALQPGTDEIIEAIGLGWMVGFKKSDTESWNIGLGFVIDPSVKILGDDIEENQILPAGETQIRLKETSQGGFFLLASFTF